MQLGIMKVKNIITHKSPDLDSCVAIWILKRFVLKEFIFNYHFVDVGQRIENLENSIHVDTGGIDYDHHFSAELISAASLVYTKNNVSDSAIKRIVDYTVLVDHGKTIHDEYHFMNLTYALNGLIGRESKTILDAAFVILDGIYNSLLLESLAENELSSGLSFSSYYGSGIAFSTENPQLRRLSYRKGYEIFLFKDKETGYAGYKAPGDSSIDFSSLYTVMKEIEPEADWFLHSSNQLLLCGSSKAPGKKLTKLSLKKLISIITEYAPK
jgi:hypothetical protein